MSQLFFCPEKVAKLLTKETEIRKICLACPVAPEDGS
jgi:hypothetical protein